MAVPNSTLSDVMLVACNQPWCQYLPRGSARATNRALFPSREPAGTHHPLSLYPNVNKMRGILKQLSEEQCCSWISVWTAGKKKKKKKTVYVCKNLRNFCFSSPNSPSSYSLFFLGGWTWRAAATESRKTWVDVISLALLTGLFFPRVVPKFYSPLVERMPKESNFSARGISSELEVSVQKRQQDAALCLEEFCQTDCV